MIWSGRSAIGLARRVEAFITEIQGLDLTPDQIADQLAEVLTADHNPLDTRPRLGPPPTVRPATPPPRKSPYRGVAPEPGS